MPHIDPTNELASVAVDINARLRDLPASKRPDFILVVKQSYLASIYTRIPSLNTIFEQHTNGTSVWSSYYRIIFKFQVLVEDRIIELDFAIESISNFFPARGRAGHGHMLVLHFAAQDLIICNHFKRTFVYLDQCRLLLHTQHKVSWIPGYKYYPRSLFGHDTPVRLTQLWTSRLPYLSRSAFGLTN